MSSITSVFARLVSRELLAAGATETALFTNTNLDANAVWQEPEIPLKGFLRLLENAERMKPQTPLGFLIGRHYTALTLGRLGVAMGCAPNIREGLRQLESYSSLQASYVRVEPATRPGGMSIRLHFLDALGGSLVHHAEATIMLLQNHIEYLSGERLEDARYRFSYSTPAHIAAYRENFHSPCLFEQEEISLELPRRWLDLRSPFYHAELWNQSLRQLAQNLSELGASDNVVYTRHIRALLRSSEPPFPALANLAAKLHMSERTLNRRLGKEGSSFREIRNQVLSDLACQHLLETDANIESIAATLGYQDAANFRRAFQARTHMTPSEYRSRAANSELLSQTP